MKGRELPGSRTSFCLPAQDVILLAGQTGKKWCRPYAIYRIEQMTAREDTTNQLEHLLSSPAVLQATCAASKLNLRRHPLWQVAEMLDIYHANGLINLLLLYNYLLYCCCTTRTACSATCLQNFR